MSKFDSDKITKDVFDGIHVNNPQATGHEKEHLKQIISFVEHVAWYNSGNTLLEQSKNYVILVSVLRKIYATPIHNFWRSVRN